MSVLDWLSEEKYNLLKEKYNMPKKKKKVKTKLQKPRKTAYVHPHYIRFYNKIFIVSKKSVDISVKVLMSK